MAFLNRTDDLAALEDNWSAREARFYVLWGRRRVGKTELLAHFAEGRRALHFEATDTAQTDQLRDLSSELARVSGDRLLAEQPLASWEAALAAIERFASDERTVVVLDEFQYLAERNPALGTTLNRWWRQIGRKLPLVLVIAGSEVSFFEQDVLAGQLYGRRTGQWQVVPFGYRDAALFVPSYSPDDRVRTYAVCGGMPYYLERFDDKLPLAENILRHILRRDGFLHEEAQLLLRQELDDPVQYFSVLRAIANGRTRNSQIADWVQVSPGRATQLTTVLERLQLIEQRRPVTAGPRSKKTTYAILDGFLNFYFRFVDPYRSLLRTHAGAERHLEQTVLPGLDHFVSKPAWEAVCRAHMREAEGVSTVGSWWGPVPTGDGRRTEERELDAVALGVNGRVMAVGSCKWTNAPTDIGEEAPLTRLEAALPGAPKAERHYFYSRSGFAQPLMRLADAEPQRVRLVTPADLYE
jgi:AAA+ ATPase superfamily predicted ATPase